MPSLDTTLSKTGKKLTVEIIWPVPKFVCPVRFINCGPYEKKEVVSLPEPVARLLIKKRRAKEWAEPKRSKKDY